MTADELKKLAKLAKLKLVKRHFHHTDKDGCFVYYPAYFSGSNFYCYVSDWQPHLRIEQAYLVESGIPGNKQLEYMCALQDIVVSDVPDEWIPGAGFLTFSVVHANANQRCHAALAAAKEGQNEV